MIDGSQIFDGTLNAVTNVFPTVTGTAITNTRTSLNILDLGTGR